MSNQINTLRSVSNDINAVVEYLPVPKDAKFVFSVKDSIEVAGCRCTAGTWGYRDRPPAQRDAAGARDDRVTIPLLQNLLVLAVGRDTGGEAALG